MNLSKTADLSNANKIKASGRHYAYYLRLIIILLSGLLIFNHCGSPEKKKTGEWQTIKETNTVEAYEKYLEENPDSEHAKEAKQNIVQLLADQAKDGEPVIAYDKYIEIFPEGKNREVFEKYIYEEAVKKNSPEILEAYLQRFPEGKYINEIQKQLLSNDNNEGDVSVEEFLDKFPQSRKDEIEQLLYDSAMRMNAVSLYDKYLKFFPEGEHAAEIDSVLESTFYQRAVESNRRADYYNYLARFPRSDKVHSIELDIGPEGTEIRVLDSLDSLYRKVVSPSAIYAIENTLIKIDVNVPDYKQINFDYTVTEDDNQSIERELEILTRVIAYDDFEGNSTPWSYKEDNSSADIVTGDLLECIAAKAQEQKIREFEFDLNNNFQIKLRLKFENTQQLGTRPHFGILWGEENNMKYFFISKDGNYNFGGRSQGATAPQNPFGYTQWGKYSPERDNWTKAINYNNDGFNELKIMREGRKIKYFINGKYMHFENDINRYNSSFVGFGFGNVKVHVDYIIIEQFYE